MHNIFFIYAEIKPFTYFNLLFVIHYIGIGHIITDLTSIKTHCHGLFRTSLLFWSLVITATHYRINDYPLRWFETLKILFAIFPVFYM